MLDNTESARYPPNPPVAADENADGKLLTAGEGIGQQLAIRQQQAPVGRTFQQPPGQNLRGATPTPRGRNFNRGS